MNYKELIYALLKNTRINFLLGAGTSYNQIPGKINFPLMSDLLNVVKADTRVEAFYKRLVTDKSIPSGSGQALKKIYDEMLIGSSANIEKFLSAIEGMDAYVGDDTFLNDIVEQRDIIKKIIRDRLKESEIETVIDNYINFYSGLIKTKELTAFKNQIINVFTTNYDMMNEIAMEKLHIHYYSGFEGVVNRSFNLTYYNYDFVENFALNKINVKVVPNHINLFKLHGSLSWCNIDGDLVEKNPLDMEFIPEIIYPSVDKYDNTTLITSYSSLMREFSSRLCQGNTSLFVSGMSMGDEHINKIIENALTINTFHLVIFCATADEIDRLSKKYSSHKNVIIFDEVCTFNDLAELIGQLQ